MGLGLLVAIESFLGFPNTWDTYILVFLGICIIGMGIVVRRAKRSVKPKPTVQPSMRAPYEG